MIGLQNYTYSEKNSTLKHTDESMTYMYKVLAYIEKKLQGTFY